MFESITPSLFALGSISFQVRPLILKTQPPPLTSATIAAKHGLGCVTGKYLSGWLVFRKYDARLKDGTILLRHNIAIEIAGATPPHLDVPVRVGVPGVTVWTLELFVFFRFDVGDPSNCEEYHRFELLATRLWNPSQQPDQKQIISDLWVTLAPLVVRFGE